ncbi:MAG TPA: carboxymuconolactone decarboxylase family protein [Chloroflexota bacterium]|nr:carboxymuconolactone decarboxylase family protein [Chloroflexota bacterium]
MARVPYRGEDAEVAELYREIAGLRGSVLNLYRALANQPEALRAFMGVSRYVRDAASLDPALRELAILATAYALDVPYEKFHHLPAARRAGVAESKLAAFPAWRGSAAFGEAERAVLAYADEVARRRDVAPDTFATLRRFLSNAEIADLALTVGWYHLCAAIVGPLQIDIED